MRTLLSRRVAPLLALVTVIAGVACQRPGPPGPPVGSRNPVVFVHGFGLSGPLQWNGVMATFRSRGYPADRLSAPTYKSKDPIATSSDTLGREVEAILQRTGATKV